VTILEERGLFWWHGEPVPDTQFAPDASVLGLLKTDDEGLTMLVLDGYLASDHGPMGVLSRDPRELKGKIIEGILSTGLFSSLDFDGAWGFQRAKICESIGDNPNRRLSDGGVAVGDFALGSRSSAAGRAAV
jgi:hypothetical protein